MSDLLKSLQEAILTIDEETALVATQDLLDSGMEPEEILESGMTEALLELGRRWNCGEAFLPEVVAAAGIFERCSELVEPALMAKADRKVSDKAIIATVKGDLHDLGKNIVGAGYAGIDVQHRRSGLDLGDGILFHRCEVSCLELCRQDLAPGGVDPLADDDERLVGADDDLLAR